MAAILKLLILIHLNISRPRLDRLHMFWFDLILINEYGCWIAWFVICTHEPWTGIDLQVISTYRTWTRLLAGYLLRTRAISKLAASYNAIPSFNNSHRQMKSCLIISIQPTLKKHFNSNKIKLCGVTSQI